MSQSIEALRNFAVPGRIEFEAGQKGLPYVRLRSAWAEAEAYLHGAHVTGYQRHNELPLLFLSSASRFAPDKAIRGGIPICFPWFGPRQGDVAHGFARITDWEVAGAQATAAGETRVRFRLPAVAGAAGWPNWRVDLTVTVSDRLVLDLVVTNADRAQVLEFEACFHSYFNVGEVEKVEVIGLEGARYRDLLTGREGTEQSGPIRITAQTDRTYYDHTAPVEIHDPVLQRTIRVDKSGSRSSVLWNPWTTQPLADLGEGEYRRMLCVESGNVGANRVRLKPGEASHLSVSLSSQAMA